MMTGNLNGVTTAIGRDPGIRANNVGRDLAMGLAGCDDISEVFVRMMSLTGINDDRRLTPADMGILSRMKQEHPALFLKFDDGHGKDNGDYVRGYHHLRGDGGTMKFQGLDWVDTVADTIYSYGYVIEDGQYFNHDGPTGKSPRDAAGWINFFVNGVNAVYGTGRNDELGSGVYSDYFAKARSETFLAGDGDDKVWADRGNDRIYGGDGHDEAGGGTGSDRMYGEAGRDVLYGETGRDRLYGGNGNDRLGGGDQADRLFGGWGQDTIYGEDGYDRLEGGLNNDELMGGNADDRLFGDEGNDKVYGDNGDDAVSGGDGNDTIGGGAGRDTLTGGDGADTFELWEMAAARDVVRIGRGDSGVAQDDRDLVEGFRNGTDFVDLRGLGKLEYRADEFRGDGKASFLFQVQDDGFNELRIDLDGDRAADMIVEFHWAGDLTRGDFLFNN